MDELNLLNILEAFNAAINEEQAWAVCYQCCKYFESQWKDSPATCLCLDGLESLILNKDGIVSKVHGSEGGLNVVAAPSEEALVESVGVVLFQALDFGLSEEEEHQLSPPLEALIDRMTGGGGSLGRRSTESGISGPQGVGGEAGGAGQGDHGDDDEGIEELEDEELEDEEERAENRLSLPDVLTVCKIHLANSSEEASHYKAVVRALVTEAVELITFLDKIIAHNQRLREQPSTDAEELLTTDLKRADWARLWMQIMKNLRKGVKLKKVDSSSVFHAAASSPSEFELTPYEVLMEDIRTRRYELRKVMVNGDIPTTVKKDAHEVILDFIRSRPPLHPMNERQLANAPIRPPDMRELLMTDIKQHRTLRPTPGNTGGGPGHGSNGSGKEGLWAQNENTPPQTARKIIKPNICLFNDSDDDDDDEDMSEEEEEEDRDDEDKNKVTPSPLSPLTPLSPDARKTGVHSRKAMWRADTTDSDVVNGDAPGPPRQPPANMPDTDDLGITGGNIVGPHGPAGPLHGFMTSYNSSGQGRDSATTAAEIPPSLQSSLECLALTVEEVMHIRNVLTKAELECLVSRPELYKLVSAGKVCFTCKKTKFTLFGSWATKCKFCRRNVCSRCSSKMRIPTEHFENIPVYTLSPSPISPNTSSTNLFFFESNGSAPSSPTTARKPILPFFNTSSSTSSTSSASSASTNQSLPLNRRGSLEDARLNTQPQRPPLQRTQTTVKAPTGSSRGAAASASAGAVLLQGPLMAVCKDCKSMIVNIIRASRLCLGGVHPSASDSKVSKMRGRAQVDGEEEEEKSVVRPARNFHLNLKPVHQFGNGAGKK